VYVYGERYGFHPVVYRVHRGTGVVCWKADLPKGWDSALDVPRLEPFGTAAFYTLPYDGEKKQTRVYRLTGF
jgi:hypothetical protein